MKLIVAVFIYLGINSTSSTITSQDIQDHRTEIEATLIDPDFHEFAEEVMEIPGITQIDLDEL